MTNVLNFNKKGVFFLLLPLLLMTLPIKAATLLVLFGICVLWLLQKQFNEQFVHVLIILSFSLLITILLNGYEYISNYVLFLLFISPLLFLISTPHRKNLYEYHNVKKVFEYFLVMQIIFSIVAMTIRYLEFRSFDLNFGDVVAGTLRNPFIYSSDASNVTFAFMMILVTVLYSTYFKKDSSIILISSSLIVIFFSSVNHLILAAVASIGLIFLFKKPILSSALVLLITFFYMSFQESNFNLIIERLELIYGLVVEGTTPVKNLKLEYILNYLNDFANESFKFTFLGSGLGTYSSRAALFFTGEYVSSFPFVNINTYFQNNTYYLWNILINANPWDAGSFNFPYSSLFTILAEFGLVLGVWFLILLYKSMSFLNDFFPKLQLGLFVFLILASLVDNYLEYYQATFVFFYFTYLLRGIHKNEE